MAKLRKTGRAVSQKVANALIQMQEAEIAAEQAKISGWSSPANYKGTEELLKNLGLL